MPGVPIEAWLSEADHSQGVGAPRSPDAAPPAALGRSSALSGFAAAGLDVPQEHVRGSCGPYIGMVVQPPEATGSWVFDNDTAAVQRRATDPRACNVVAKRRPALFRPVIRHAASPLTARRLIASPSAIRIASIEVSAIVSITY